MRRALLLAFLTAAVAIAGCVDSTSPDSGAEGTAMTGPYDADWTFATTIVDNAVFKVTEPSMDVAPDGTIWITGPTGFTRGATSQDPGVYTHDHGLFSSTDGGLTWTANTPIPGYGRDVCPGGGDSDLAVAPDGAMFLIDLNLESVPIAVSTDGGASWLFNCQSNLVPGMDRQWVQASDDYVWVMANQLGAGPMMWRAARGGLTPDGLVFTEAPTLLPLTGPLVRDAGNGNLYLPGSSTQVARSTDDGASWTTFDTGNTFANRGPFQNIAVDDAGNIFHTGAGSDGVWVVGSGDQGETWSEPAVIHPYDGEYMFAWGAATGDGTFAVAWYGHPDNATDDLPADGWYLYAAQTTSVLDGDMEATLRVTRVDPEPVTTKTICSGTGCDVIGGSAVTRMLGDFFETAFDQDGNFIITYDRVSDAGDPILMFASGPLAE